ncbi:hypothetical protein CHS0354_033259 [Potamilus streckersoni]|uniref:Uncharacterized protein n=1 Tax=Potamilus streckersoni TaxID=2493646 RepID=A0AAE0S775_9BIVA|nr:hypothetical protein CHS0354_033259 [Potamilus streckersoni]
MQLKNHEYILIQLNLYIVLSTLEINIIFYIYLFSVTFTYFWVISSKVQSDLSLLQWNHPLQACHTQDILPSMLSSYPRLFLYNWGTKLHLGKYVSGVIV